MIKSMSKKLKSKKIMEETRKELTPSQIVGELNKYIIGQHEAKRAVAIALKKQVAASINSG